jgi:hypothetical protein
MGTSDNGAAVIEQCDAARGNKRAVLHHERLPAAHRLLRSGIDMYRTLFIRVVALTVSVAGPLAAQVQTQVPAVVDGARPVFVERIKIHGTSLERNLEGDAVERDALVFLPPGYRADKNRRYPVIYALHGYWIGAEQWSTEIHVPQTIEGAFAQGAKEMIVVLPDSKTVHNGSMYSSSATTATSKILLLAMS